MNPNRKCANRNRQTDECNDPNNCDKRCNDYVESTCPQNTFLFPTEKVTNPGYIEELIHSHDHQTLLIFLLDVLSDSTIRLNQIRKCVEIYLPDDTNKQLFSNNPISTQLSNDISQFTPKGDKQRKSTSKSTIPSTKKKTSRY